MAVEIYMEENQNLIAETEDLERWKELVKETGLSGQKNLAKGDKSPIPFPFMTNSMENVYEILCPIKAKAKEYEEATVPLRVLEMVALANKENYFDELRIWHNEKNADPILVGTIKDKNRAYITRKYIIARWGDELCSFEELKQRAIQKLKEIELPKLKEQQRKACEFVENFDDYAMRKVNGENIWFNV